MKNLLLKLENCIEESKNPILNYLDSASKKFNEEEYIETIRGLKLEPHSDLIELYKWKTGVNAKYQFSQEFDFRMFSFGSPIAFNDTYNLYLLDQNTNRYFTKNYLPIIYDGIIEDPVLINLKPKSKDFGRIYYYSPAVTLSSTPIVVYDSLKSCINTIIECYIQKVYYIAENGRLESQDKELNISRILNKNANSYWSW